MHLLLWLPPLAIIAAGVWLITLIPASILAVVGFITLLAIVIGGVGLACLAILAAGMAS